MWRIEIYSYKSD
jgi:HD superfamily phosphohydrolase